MQAQPYRAGGSRAPSPVLDAMLAGRSASGHEQLMRSFHKKRGTAPARAPRVPRVPPLRKRVR